MTTTAFTHTELTPRVGSFVYTHEWEINDLVIWNNTGAMHRVREYDPDYGRRLHRTTLLGDEPFDTGEDHDARQA